MFFKDYFISISDCLDAKFKGIKRKGQNTSDEGELCEMFVKEFLNDFFIDLYKIFRGGKIVDINNAESKQLDIILTAKNTLKIFGDKGIYPIESVFGVFSITANLSRKKLNDCLKEFKSIPKDDPKFLLNEEDEVKKIEIIQKWQERVPYKCVFGFTGSINQKWEHALNEMVEQDKKIKNQLPNLIVVNQKGIIIKIPEIEKPKEIYIPGKGIEYVNKDFHFTDLKKLNNSGAFLMYIANELYYLSTLQNIAIPQYNLYFNKDIEHY